MAQLKSTVVSGSLRVTDSTYTSTLQTQILHAPTASNGTSYGAGTDGQILRTNGTSAYWGNAPASGVTSITIQTSSPLSGGSATATTGTGSYTIGFANQNKNLVLAGPSTGSAAAPTFRALVAADIPDLGSTYLKLDGSNNMTGSVNIITGDTDKFINFWYNTSKTAGASWRLGELGSGSNDANYFVIQSGTSTTSATTWNNAIRIGINTRDVNLPSTTASTSKTTGALVVGGGAGFGGTVYANAFNGPLTGNVTGNCSGSSGSCTGTAAKATGDADGNAIKTTYAKLSSAAFTGNVSTTGVLSVTNTTASTSTTTGAVKISGGLGVAGSVYGTSVYGAVWNDYAEYRQAQDQVKPGNVVIDTDRGTLRLSTKRLQPGAQVVSDTFGFAIGKTDECETPLAVSGRVLAYTYQPRENYHAGMAVCSAPNGTIDIMTREEIQKYPDAIIGIVSEIPNYESWGTGNVPINGRIWIKVR